MRFKYPRTHHLPCSLGYTSDDKVLKSTKIFENQNVVMSEKIDGESSTIYSDGYCHARSMDSKHHASRSWLKGLASQLTNQIPKGYRVCGENVFAFHSIFYLDLPSYFLVFGVYDNNNVCLSWEDTVEFCQILDLHTVPVIYEGIWDEELIKSKWTGKGAYPTFETQVDNPEFPKDFNPCTAEGYVVRRADVFKYDDFEDSVAKMVRKNHVQTDEHWLDKPVFPNRLK